MMAAAERVLVVEDDPTLRQIVELSLMARGYRLDVAASGADALALIERHPDLIVLDLGLPDMDGIDLVIQLRTALTTPILVVSARPAGIAQPAALGAGADDFLPKPFAIDEPIGRVRALLSQQAPPAGEPGWISA
jgi:two-component system, OmpR family, KDP operon response regulator KdpE